MTGSFAPLITELQSAATTLRTPTGSPWPHQDKITAELIERAAAAIADLQRARGSVDHVESAPGWDSAPEWAKWRAMDACGDWYWFERKPYPESIDGAPGDGINVWDVEDGQMHRASTTEAAHPDWERSLQARPEVLSGCR